MTTEKGSHIFIRMHTEVFQNYTCDTVDLTLPLVHLNWKPQFFLELHELVKEYTKYEPVFETSSE